MPELPEVETVRRTLEVLVLGKTISKIDVHWPNIIKEPADSHEFAFMLTGQTIRSISRRGKFLLFYLDNYCLVSHLRMEGRYGLFQKDDPLDKHTHVIFHFMDGSELRYKDVRKFGTMHVYPIGSEMSIPPLSGVGPEPFSEEFTVNYFEKGLQKTSRHIKTVLLDQKVVCGLGNIYVDESLFKAGIHPLMPANELSSADIGRLYVQIKETLAEAVEKGGSTVRSYVNSQGQMGMFQLELFVYGRKGEPCKRCGQTLERLIVGGRGTVICPNCQQRH